MGMFEQNNLGIYVASPVPGWVDALASLHARGARRFRFVDRTFNLRIDTAGAILDFFLARQANNPADPVFAHFEQGARLQFEDGRLEAAG
jgi:hypothetical protein